MKETTKTDRTAGKCIPPTETGRAVSPADVARQNYPEVKPLVCILWGIAMAILFCRLSLSGTEGRSSIRGCLFLSPSLP